MRDIHARIDEKTEEQRKAIRYLDELCITRHVPVGQIIVEAVICYYRQLKGVYELSSTERLLIDKYVNDIVNKVNEILKESIPASTSGIKTAEAVLPTKTEDKAPEVSDGFSEENVDWGFLGD